MSESPSAPPPPSSACRPKRQTFSRFLRRSPYGERRSRAVAPADTVPHANSTESNRRRRGAGGNDLTRRRDSNVALMRPMNRVRLAVGEFMRLLAVEMFFVMIVLFYGVFVTVQLAMADETLASYKLAIDTTDVTVGSILLLEILLKVFAYGLHYLRDIWALFDAVVIVVSFVLGVVAALGSKSSILVKILRLRVILRVLRVLVVFERVKQRSRSMNLKHLNKGAITSPVENVLRILNELRFHPAIRPSLRDGLEFAIDAIKNNRLYDANEDLLAVEGVDDDTQNWLRGEMLRANDTNKVLPDAQDEEDSTSPHLSGGNALCHVGHHLLRDAPCLALNIESNLLTVYYFLVQPELGPFLRPLDRALALLAAENYHVAQSFLVMKNADLNVLGELAPDDFKYARDMIIQMVLATDMSKHFEDVALFKTNILSASLDEGTLAIKSVGDKKLLLKMILHTCDVSNPAKDREIMLRWTDRVVEEFFIQGEMEKQLSLPVSPFMDRDTIVIKKMQVGFADFIVAPLFSVWAQILPNVNAVAYRTLLANREFWASLSDDFKPHMIKDVVRDLGLRKQRESNVQNTIVEEQQSPRSRRSVTSMVLGTDDG
ncbi:hypothetical protein JM18_002172 [Phytophthora kernoviae]|uniref:PDEase domain-containing protein n=2 Tax=Phytophthora kernoviae TaxID=325452 RepID=A0A8T0M0P4_9STRA|nr:hypothetical protein G195_002958 [Phytophthora kernoviae 00238/432]KAG2526247.1 hypothetical protein JM16_002067 [Phytophthora kernoviae]KAG2527822.1 hypothetical protein JM18_002172 [Phytophthora kernoviae]